MFLINSLVELGIQQKLTFLSIVGLDVRGLVELEKELRVDFVCTLKLKSGAPRAVSETYRSPMEMELPVTRNPENLAKFMMKPAVFERGEDKFCEFKLKILPYVINVSDTDFRRVLTTHLFLGGLAASVSPGIIYPDGDLILAGIGFKEYWSQLEKVFNNPECELITVRRLRDLKHTGSLGDYVWAFTQIIPGTTMTESMKCALF
jgi:hypothetical protein